MPQNLPNEYLNIFGGHILTKQRSEYILTQETAQIRIQIIFEDHFIGIFKYLYSSMIVVTLEKGFIHAVL